jgi:hypothetical protein
MSYRRIFLAGAATFIGWLLWLVIEKDSATSSSAVWPLIFAFLIILVLPETRLKAETFVELIKAWKGKPNDSG